MDQKFQIGDRLCIREWDDMQAQFGLSVGGNIPCQFAFTKEMLYLCGEVFTVKGIRNDGRYLSEEAIEGRYSISEDMLEPIPISYIMTPVLDSGSATRSKTELFEFLSTIKK